MPWTDERVETLRKMWVDGFSASQIAGELGGGVTRNAVIGKVHRLGLSGTRAKAPTQAMRTRPLQAKTAMRPNTPHAAPLLRGATALVRAAQPFQQPCEKLASDIVVDISERVTIMDLRDTMCRWPLGDPTSAEFRFCGGVSREIGPYCAHHSRIAYQPAQDRRRERERRMLRTG